MILVIYSADSETSKAGLSNQGSLSLMRTSHVSLDTEVSDDILSSVYGALLIQNKTIDNVLVISSLILDI